MIWDEKPIWKEVKPKSSFDRSYNSVLSLQQKFPALNIRKHLPIGISYFGELITIPKTNFATNICISGQKQTLKSYFLYGLCDREYWYWNKRCFLCNDIVSFLSYDHRYANNIPLFQKYLQMGSEQKRGLPLVFCFPSTNNLNLINTPRFSFHKLKLSIPFKEFLNDYRKFQIISGTEMKLSENIFQKNKHRFENKTSAEILEACGNLTAVKTGKDDMGKSHDVPKPSARKIYDMMRKIIDEEVFDIDQNGESSIMLKITDKKIKTDPISGLLLANLIPSLVTNNLSSHDHFMKEVFEYFIERVFKEKEEGILRPFPISIFCDEFHILIEKKNIDILKRVVRESSNLPNGGIEFNYVVQNYSKVDNYIKNNTHYLIAARNVGDEVVEISKDFSLEKSEVKDIKSLPKLHCYFLTKEQFRVFAPDKNKSYSTNDPIKGFVLPPLSKHRPI